MHLRPGVLLYHLFYKPYGRIRDSLRLGGPLVEKRIAEGKRTMEKEAEKLPLLGELLEPALDLHLLTGCRFWYQSAYCLWTFAKLSKQRLRPHFYDDGTLTPQIREHLQRVFPDSVFQSIENTKAKLDEYLPLARFPFLRERWEAYPNIRKLTDVHLGGKGWKLVIDSDLLFFRRPDFLLDWLAGPSRPLHAVDCMESYGYSRRVMEALTGCRLSPLVNVGLCGLRSETLDWEKLEFWTRTLIEKEKTNYYLEQALVAMLLAGQDCAVAPVKDYLTLPTRSECENPKVVMHHYVDTSKRWYFTTCFQQVLHSSAQRTLSQS